MHLHRTASDSLGLIWPLRRRRKGCWDRFGHWQTITRRWNRQQRHGSRGRKWQSKMSQSRKLCMKAIQETFDPLFLLSYSNDESLWMIPHQGWEGNDRPHNIKEWLRCQSTHTDLGLWGNTLQVDEAIADFFLSLSEGWRGLNFFLKGVEILNSGLQLWPCQNKDGWMNQFLSSFFFFNQKNK